MWLNPNEKRYSARKALFCKRSRACRMERPNARRQDGVFLPTQPAQERDRASLFHSAARRRARPCVRNALDGVPR